MRSAIAQRAARLRSGSQRSAPLRTAPPPKNSDDFDEEYAAIAAGILYRSPLSAQSGLPLYILNAAALPDTSEVEYDELLPYVLDRFPQEDDLIAGVEYEVVFFAGGQPDNVVGERKSGPAFHWYLQVYQVLSRALRKRLQKIWIVHERTWVRMLTEVFGTIVSPKFKRKIVHVSTLSHLAMHIPVENLLIPPAVYLNDRKLSPDIYVPYATGRRAFSANNPLPVCRDGKRRLPRVLRETTSFLVKDNNSKTEGLFRIPPRKTMLDVLREAYDRGQHFIVWGEGRTVSCEPMTPRITLQEVQRSDMYGVHLAAALTKVWYRELLVPIFPESCYAEVMAYGRPTDDEVTLQDLTTIFSPKASESPVPSISRQLLTRHLLPLLSIIVADEPSNKMNADNLAICFAPALVAGDDQIQEARMMRLLRQLLSRAVTLWSQGLREACGCDDRSFYAQLLPPTDRRDYEDPPGDMNPPQDPSQSHGHVSRRSVSSVVASDRPPLPRRPESSQGEDRAAAPVSPVPRRKVAPSNAPMSNLPTTTPALITPPLSELEKTTQRHCSVDGQIANIFGTLQVAEPESMDTLKRPITPNSEPVSPLLGPTVGRLPTSQVRSVSGDSTKSQSEHLFIKPTWAASSRQASGSSVTSERRSSPPLIVPKKSGDNGSRIDSGVMTNGFNVKPRAPSPGLLMRMQSWEKEANESNSSTREDSVNERKQSVDSLRKLYEDRAITVASMPPMARTLSNASRRSQT